MNVIINYYDLNFLVLPGICFIGTFFNQLPNNLALDAAKDIISCGVERGTIKVNYLLQGHRDGSVTDCPGDSLYNYIRTWANYGK